MRNLRVDMEAFVVSAGWRTARRIALVAFAAMLPVWPAALPAFTVAMLVLMLPWRDPAAFQRTPFTAGWMSRPSSWLLLWYALHIVGMLWTTDTAHGLFDLEVKALFLLLPFWCAWSPGAWSEERGIVLRVFLWSTALMMLFLMARSTVLFIRELQWRATGDYPDGLPYTNIFFSSYFSPWLHPSYLAMYAVFALCVVAFPRKDGTRGVVERLVLPAILVAGVLLSVSKTGWVALLLLSGYVLWSRWREPRVRRTVLWSAVVAVGAFAVLVASFGTVRAKFTDTWHALQAPDETGEDSSSSRVLVWRSAWQVVGETPAIGTGTGDVKNELMRVYAERGYVYPLERRLNAHSQFLQTAAALGIPAALLLLVALFRPIRDAIWRKQHLLLAFLVLALVNWSVESMLEVQAGVLFFAFFAALLADSTTDQPVA